MRLIEDIIRRLLFSFSVAIGVTVSFNRGESFIFYLAPITIGLGFILFLLSWRIEKEFSFLFIKEVENDQSMWGQFEKKYPRFANVMWQWFVTFAAMICLVLALDFIWLIEVNGERLKWFLVAFSISFGFRIFDYPWFRK